MTSLLLPASRLVRWIQNFTARHDGCELAVAEGALTGAGGDGSTFVAAPPFGRQLTGQAGGLFGAPPESSGGEQSGATGHDAGSVEHSTPADALIAELIEQCTPPREWGVLLVRKGGFAVARLNDSVVVESKVGQRHVQGRTKAGGQSQQRFARRRDNQARQAYEAAAGHALRILGPFEERLRSTAGAPDVVLVTGGDHDAVAAVLADPRLRKLAERVVEPFLSVPDPRRSVLESAIADAGSVRMTVINT